MENDQKKTDKLILPTKFNMPLNGNDFKIGGKYVTALHCLQETNFKYVDVQEWKKKKVEKYNTQIQNQENVELVIIILPGRELRTVSKID